MEERRMEMSKSMQWFGNTCTYCAATGLIVMAIITGAVLLWMLYLYM